MASEDDFDFDWDDDPFGGDLDFDSDFSGKKKGKIRSLASGFLSGLRSNTIGDTDARIKTARTLLPSSFAGAFDTVSQMNKMRKTVLEEIKAESSEAIKDAQFLVGSATEKFRKFIPNRIAEGALEFSQRDFSDWEKPSSSSGSTTPTIGESSDEDLRRLIEDTRASNLQNTDVLYGFGNAVTETLGRTGGLTIGRLSAVGQGIGKSNVLLKQIYDYQRKVQAKNDAMKINLLARMHITNAKFYKFVEASNHKMIEELRGINRNSALSDFQKTSMGQAARQSIRDNFFKTTMTKAGGIMGYFKDTFGKDARDNVIGGVGGLLSDARMAVEMSSGMPINYAEMAGEMLAGVFIDKLPEMVRKGVGSKYVAEFSKKNPKLARWAKEQYKKVEEVGNVASYSLSNAEGIANTLAKNYKGGFDSSGYHDYDDYADQMYEAGVEPMSRAAFAVLDKAKKLANKGITGVLDNTYLGQGRQINLTQRHLRDGMEPSIWNRSSERALTEIIPQWLSNIHLSIEKMRTGNDGLKAETYDYVKGKFVSHSDNIKSIQKQLFNRNQFSSQAYMASNLAGSVDKNNALSKGAKDALSLQLAKQSDSGFGFSPYNFMNLEQEGVSKKEAEEIRQMMKANFGITDEHMETFANGSDIDRLKLLTKLPTKEGNALANSVINSSKSLGRFTPDITEMIDVLRNSGQYGAMKDAGVITNNNGIDSVDMGRFWDTLGLAIADPNGKDSPTTAEQQRGRSIRRQALNAGVDNEVLTEAIKELTTTLSSTQKGFVPTTQTTDVSGLMDGITGMTSRLDTLVEKASSTNSLLGRILERQPIDVEGPKTEDEAKKIKGEKTSIINKLKNTNFRGMFNAGVEKLLAADPIILGTMLGGLAVTAIKDPKAAALLAGGGLAVAAYTKYRAFAKTSAAKEGDLYLNPDDAEPILEEAKLRNNDYLDMVTKKILKSWDDIKGSVKDISTGIVIGAKKLANKLFTKDNKEVFLRGLNRVRELGMRLLKMVDPINRLKSIGGKITDRFNQLDVYKEGEDSPTLIGRKFATQSYFKRNENGEMIPLKGWNDIDGPVYDAQGECIITQDEFERGLKTSMGVSIGKMGAMANRFGKFGLDIFGKAKDKLINKTGQAKDAVKNAFSDTKIISSIDRIYLLLAKQFGTTVDDDAIQEFGRKAVEEITQKPDGKTRRNSLADKETQERAKKEEKVKDSIISIAENLAGNKDEDKGPEKRKGILGMLFGGLNALKNGAGAIAELIFGKTIMKGFGALFKFSTMGLKVLPAIAGSLGFIAKNIISLLRGNGMGMGRDWGGNTVEPDGSRSRRGKKTGGRNTGRRFKLPGGRIGRIPGMGMLKGVGIAGAVGLGTNMLLDSGMVEEGGVAELGLEGAGMAANAYGAYTLANMGLGLAGTSVGGVLSGAGSLAAAGIGGLGTLLGGTAATAGAILTSPITLTALAVGGIGYGLYKMYNRGKGTQLDVRMAQYGAHAEDDEFAQGILKAEKLLTPHVVVRSGQAYFSTDAPLDQALLAMKGAKGDVGDIYTFLNGRFKPVFLTYMMLLDSSGIKSLEEYDKQSDRKAYDIAKQSHEILMGMVNQPYAIQAKIDKDYYTLPLDATVTKVSELLSKLKAYMDRTKKDVVEEAEKQKSKISSSDDLERQKQELEDKKSKAGWFEGRQLQHEIDGLDEQIKRLNTIYAPTKAVGRVNIDDLRGKDGKVDLFTQFRLYAYGDEDHEPDRVEAVLRLERQMESLITVQDGQARFNGKTGDIYNEFKEAFGVTDKQSGEWCTWFRDRFLPVLMTYMVSMSRYRQGKPQYVWRALTDTAKYEIAKDIGNTKVKPPEEKRTQPIWRIKASPFPGVRSSDSHKAATTILMALKAASDKAKLKDPVGEAEKTSSLDNIAARQGHAVGGGVSDKQTLGQGTTGNAYRDNLLRNGSGGDNYDQYKIGDNYVYTPVTGDSDVNKVDLSKVTANQGQDSGVSVPKDVAEQLIIKEMLAQGFTDPRAIAEMLALTNYESGGYKRTTENMKYTDPKRMVELFREIRSEEQARQLIAAGPVAIANTVYGGAKGRSLGNTAPGDGYLYRGRGFVQLTGKANYARIGKEIGVDLVNNPQLASTDPKVMAKIAVNFFRNSKQLQTITDQNTTFGYAAKGLNGGNDLPNMPERFSLYKDYLSKIQSGKLSADGTQEGEPTPEVNNTNSVNYQAPGSSTGSQASSPDTPAGSGTSGGYAGPMRAAAGGEQQGDTPELSAWDKTVNTMNEASGMRTAETGSLKLKSQEAVAGGPSHPGIKRMGELIQQRVQNFRYFSALNDAYHHKLSRNSSHKSGLAIDFTLTNGINGSDAAMAVVKQIAQEGGLNNSDYLLINEYRNASSGATGGHVHFGFKSEQAADKFAKGAGVSLARDGSGAGETAPAESNIPQGVSTLPPDLGVATPGNDRMAPPVGGPQVSQQPPQDTPAPQAAPAQVTASVDTDALATALKQAMSENKVDAAQVKLMSMMLEELKKMNKNAENKPSVNV